MMTPRSRLTTSPVERRSTPSGGRGVSYACCSGTSRPQIRHERAGRRVRVAAQAQDRQHGRAGGGAGACGVAGWGVRGGGLAAARRAARSTVRSASDGSRWVGFCAGLGGGLRWGFGGPVLPVREVAGSGADAGTVAGAGSVGRRHGTAAMRSVPPSGGGSTTGARFGGRSSSGSGSGSGAGRPVDNSPTGGVSGPVSGMSVNSGPRGELSTAGAGSGWGSGSGSGSARARARQLRQQLRT